mmetsp:Transcript_147340/g.473440  ORF Transcript_147340/g.473440 Transcript_147340/m.473440 type:complete len:257 (+) Transcript_147340:350-1120(+)
MAMRSLNWAPPQVVSPLKNGAQLTQERKRSSAAKNGIQSLGRRPDTKRQTQAEISRCWMSELLPAQDPHWSRRRHKPRGTSRPPAPARRPAQAGRGSTARRRGVALRAVDAAVGAGGSNGSSWAAVGTTVGKAALAVDVADAGLDVGAQCDPLVGHLRGQGRQQWAEGHGQEHAGEAAVPPVCSEIALCVVRRPGLHCRVEVHIVRTSRQPLRLHAKPKLSPEAAQHRPRLRVHVRHDCLVLLPEHRQHDIDQPLE